MSDQSAFGRVLQQAKFRDVSFHVQKMGVSFEHDSVEHKRPYQDTSPVEQLGRNNRIYEFTIPFINNVRGSTIVEFPDNFRNFELAFSDKSAGNLSHPADGVVRVVPGKFSVSYEPNLRDGVIVTANFKEAPEDSDEFTKSLESKTGNSSIAKNIDEKLKTIEPTVEPPEKLRPSLFDAIKKIDSQINSAIFQFQSVIYQIEGVVEALDDLHNTLESVGSTTAYEVMDEIMRLMAGLLQSKETLRNRSGRRRVRFVISKTDVSFVDFCRIYKISTDDLMNLNPRLALQSEIKIGNEVAVFEGGNNG